jgi:4-coumarate--CoA ligase
MTDCIVLFTNCPTGLAVLIMQPLYRGVAVFVMRKFELQAFCKAIQQNAITVGYVVPPVVLALLNSPSTAQYDLSSLRMLHSSAAPLAPDLVRRTHSKFGIAIKQGYGASETAPGISTQSWTDWDKTLGSSGRLLPSMSLKVMDNGKELAAGEPGEIWLNGPNVFKGYHNNPDATAACLDADGYYHTGDIGFVDENHNIYITDRLKELIKYNGFQVAPAELEAILLAHPGVKDTAVVGIYDDTRATEVPKAYIVPQSGYAAGTELREQIEGWMRQKLAPYKQLRGGIEFIDEIPKSAAGKILRRVLLQKAREGPSRTSKPAKL